MATPDGWSTTSIDRLLESCVYGISSTLSVEPVGTPVLRMGNIGDHRLVLDDLKYADLSALDSEKVLLSRGDVLFNRTNSLDNVGKAALVNTERPLGFASYLLRLRTNSHAVPEWLFYLLSSPAMQGRLRALATKGVSQVNINPTKMRALEVQVPPVPEQRKIGAILSSVDEVIEKTKGVIEQLRVVKKAMMQGLLTHGLPRRHTRFKQTEIGEVPEGWRIASLESLAEPGSAITYGVVQPGPEVLGGVPFVRGGDFPEGEIDVGRLRTISSEVSDKYRRTLLKGGEVLVALVGQPGACAVVPVSLQGANVARQAAVIRCGRDIIPEFLRDFLLSDEGQRGMLVHTVGSVQQVINLKDLKRVTVPVPAPAEQAEIVARLASVTNRLTHERADLRAQRELKKALASVLLTGELRVSPDEDIA